MKNIIKIGLVGHSFSRGNFGLCALAYGELAVIERACADLGMDYDVTCFETGINHPCIDNPRVHLEEYNLKNIRKSAKQFSKCDLIFDMTGGDSFSDIYGAKLFVVHMFIKAAVYMSGAPYICAPQTYGPFYRWWVRAISNYYISKSKGVYGRDEMSGTALNGKNQKRIKCVADLGFALPYEQEPKFDKPTVGFNVNGLIYQSSNELVQGKNYQELCDKIIDFVKNAGYNVVLVPHVVGDERGVDNDYFVSVELAKRHNLPEPIFFNNPLEVKGYISKCQFFIGSRMHATIGAVSCGIPTLPLAYSRKFKGVYNNIGYDYTMDLKANTSTEILNKLSSMLENIEAVKCDVNRALEVVRTKTAGYTSDITEIISKL